MKGYNINKKGKTKRSKEKTFSMSEVLEENDVKTPKWLMKIGIGLVIEVLVVGVAADCYGVYKFFVWLF